MIKLQFSKILVYYFIFVFLFNNMYCLLSVIKIKNKKAKSKMQGSIFLANELLQLQIFIKKLFSLERDLL